MHLPEVTAEESSVASEQSVSLNLSVGADQEIRNHSLAVVSTQARPRATPVILPPVRASEACCIVGEWYVLNAQTLHRGSESAVGCEMGANLRPHHVTGQQAPRIVGPSKGFAGRGAECRITHQDIKQD